MSYLDNGSTLRSMFRLTPPQRHDIDPSRSEVLAYIMANLAVDLGRAIRAFNSMRHVKSQVLIYDRIHRQWRGCDWLPAEEVDKVSMLVASVLELKRDLAVLRSEVRKVKADVAMMRRRKGSKGPVERDDDDDVQVQEHKSSPDVNLEELKRKEDEQHDAHFRKLQEAAKDPAFWGDTPSLPPAPSVAPRSLASGSTAPTEYPWENAEDEVS